MTRTLAALAVTLAIGGCASGNQWGNQQATSETGDVMVRVANDQLFQMTVYVEGGVGARKFVGTVGPRSTSILRLPRHIVERGVDIRLIADPVGSTQEMVSESLNPGNGNWIEWKLRRGGSNRLHVM